MHRRMLGCVALLGRFALVCLWVMTWCCFGELLWRAGWMKQVCMRTWRHSILLASKLESALVPTAVCASRLGVVGEKWFPPVLFILEKFPKDSCLSYTCSEMSKQISFPYTMLMLRYFILVGLFVMLFL